MGLSATTDQTIQQVSFRPLVIVTPFDRHALETRTLQGLTLRSHIADRPSGPISLQKIVSKYLCTTLEFLTTVFKSFKRPFHKSRDFSASESSLTLTLIFNIFLQTDIFLKLHYVFNAYKMHISGH